MPLGFTAAARTQRTTRPLLQIPGVLPPPPTGVDPPPIGGSGGGTAPTAPSPITAGVPANQIFGWGGNLLSLAFLTSYDKWKADFGFNGFLTKSSAWHLLEPLESMALQFYHSGSDVTNIVDPLLISSTYNATYAYHHSWFGNQSPPVSGGTWGVKYAAPGFGIGDYKRAHPDFKFIIGMYARPTQAEANTPYMGDWYDDAHWTALTRTISNLAAGAKFVGADGLGFDNETSGHWFADPGPNANPYTTTNRPTSIPNSQPPAPLNVGYIMYANDTGQYFRWTGTAWELHTQAELYAKVEARGFQFGQGIYNTFPDCQIFQYEWNIAGGSYPNFFRPTQYPGNDGEQTIFYYGMMRAAQVANVGRATSKCKWYLWDPQFYEMTHTGGTDINASLQRIQQNTMALRSQRLPAATRDFMMSRFFVMLPSWGYGSTSNRGYWYPIPTPEYANTITTYRNWSMDGLRSEFLNISSNDAVLGPGASSGSPAQNWFTDTRTNPPGGYSTGMNTAKQSAAVNPHPSAVAPTLSASVSGTGSTRTITGTAAHSYGIHWVRAYIYPSGTPVYGVCVFNEAGGTTTTNFDNAFMTYTINLTGVTGGYAIVQAQGIMGHQKSLTVSLGGTGTIPFRLFADTSLWNTAKTSLTFDADADATLSSLTYGIQTEATGFARPLFRGVSGNPTWTVTAGAGLGKPARTVTLTAPALMSAATGADGALSIVDSVSGLLWDFYQVTSMNTTTHTFTSVFAVESDVAGTGFGDQASHAPTGSTAIGCAQASGAILATDVNNGTIPHALCMTFPIANLGGTNTSTAVSVAPAVSTNATGGTGVIPQGGLMVAQGSEPAGLTAMEHQLWLAATTYGAYCTDKLAGNPGFATDGSTLADGAFTGAGLTAIGQKLRLVRTSW